MPVHPLGDPQLFNSTGSAGHTSFFGGQSPLPVGVGRRTVFLCADPLSWAFEMEIGGTSELLLGGRVWFVVPQRSSGDATHAADDLDCGCTRYQCAIPCL